MTIDSLAVSTGATPEPTTLRVQIWSDVVCPWCFIGKRRFERAVETLSGVIDVQVEYRPYQLDPRASPGSATPVVEAYAAKFGGPERAREIIEHVTNTAAQEGVEFRMDRAIRANTRLAHRLLWWALRTSGADAQHTLKERLLDAYFTNGEYVGDPDVLAQIATRAGLDGHAARRFLSSDEGSADLEADLQFAHEVGITAVPTFVIEDRFQIPGAQDSETFVRALTRMAEIVRSERDAGPPEPVVGAACGDDSCAV